MNIELPGGLGEVVPPVPIPNTVVKRFSADDTERTTFCGKYAIARKLVFLNLILSWQRLLSGGSCGRKNGEPI